MGNGGTYGHRGLRLLLHHTCIIRVLCILLRAGPLAKAVAPFTRPWRHA